jgi:hypothetical protein
MSMDLYCRRCGEPFELLGIIDDFTDEEKKRFWSGDGCPCCFGKPAPEKRPFRCALQDKLRYVLGDDLDGLAAEMEGAAAMLGEKFNE